MLDNISFETLPKAIKLLLDEVSNLKLLIEEKNNQQVEEVEQFLTIEEASKLLKLTVPTCYSKVSKGELPYMKKGKRLYFSNIELKEYLKEGRVKTNSEIEEEVNTYLLNKKRANNG